MSLIYKQQTQGKTSILMRKLREKWVEIIKNSGKIILKILYEPLSI